MSNPCICPLCFKSVKDIDVCCHSLKLYTVNCMSCQCLMTLLPRTHFYCNNCSIKLSSCHICGELIRNGNYYVSKFESIIASDIAKLNFQSKRNNTDTSSIENKIYHKQKLLELYRKIFANKTVEQILDLDLTEHFEQNRRCYFFH